jgi:hypothetical protein
MTLNEILLITGVMTVLIIPYLLMKRIKKPINTYIRLTSGLLLLILVWFFASDSPLPIKVIMTIIVVSSAIKAIKEYLDFSRHAKTGNH